MFLKPLKGQRAAAAYVSIFNPSDKDIDKKSISTDICESAEIHETLMENDNENAKSVFFKKSQWEKFIFNLELISC